MSVDGRGPDYRKVKIFRFNKGTDWYRTSVITLTKLIEVKTVYIIRPLTV